jgi:Kef-type K+ transport system membrane component KefB
VLSVLVLEDLAMAAYLPVLTVLAVGGAWWQAGVGMLIAVGAVVGAPSPRVNAGARSSAGCCLIPNLSS